MWQSFLIYNLHKYFLKFMRDLQIFSVINFCDIHTLEQCVNTTHLEEICKFYYDENLF